MTDEHGHNWNWSELIDDEVCLRCGKPKHDIFRELREASTQPCPGRDPKFWDFVRSIGR